MTEFHPNDDDDEQNDTDGEPYIANHDADAGPTFATSESDDETEGGA